MATIQEHREWKEANPNWPLTVHPSGQWVKTINGKAIYFGPLHDRDSAYAKWVQMRSFAKPRPVAKAKKKRTPRALTVERLLAKHRSDMNDRVKAGRLAKVTRNGYAALHGVLALAGVLKTAADNMNPLEFARVARIIEASGRRLSTQKNIITSLKTVFNWGADMELCRQVNFGPRLKPPSALSIENEREKKGAIRFIEREVILAAIHSAAPPMKIAILLGINCAFYPSDTINILKENFHSEGPVVYHDFRRVKTLQKRKAVLWPETAAAIGEWWHLFRPPNRRRRTASALTSDFSRLLTGLNIKLEPGVGIGSLRYTFASVVDSVPDQKMIDLVMGHTSKGLQKRVYTTVNLDELKRLQVLSDRVRDWLYGGECGESVCG